MVMLESSSGIDDDMVGLSDWTRTSLDCDFSLLETLGLRMISWLTFSLAMVVMQSCQIVLVTCFQLNRPTRTADAVNLHSHRQTNQNDWRHRLFVNRTGIDQWLGCNPLDAGTTLLTTQVPKSGNN